MLRGVGRKEWGVAWLSLVILRSGATKDLGSWREEAFARHEPRSFAALRMTTKARGMTTRREDPRR
jgi:hypothetical protein